MKKRMIKLAATTLSIILIAVACLLIYKKSQFVYNEDNADGNTAGNLYNNGLVCEYDGKIYFSNFSDDGKLYSMDTDFSDFEKLTEDKVNCINVAGEHIVYSKINNLKEDGTQSAFQISKVGIYRTELDGEEGTFLDTSVMGMVHQYGNKIYFQYYNDDETYSFNVIDIDGENMTEIQADGIYPASIEGNTLYYHGFSNDHNLYSMDLSTGSSTLLAKGNYYNVILSGDYLYMLDLDNDHSLIRTDLSEQNKETLISETIYTYNISADQKYLYYQIDNGEDNGIHCYDLTTKKDTLLLSGDYKDINITSEYVFFADSEETTMYAVKLGDTTTNKFTPPTEDD